MGALNHRLSNMYTQSDVWERHGESSLTRYVCFQNILSKKYFVLYSTTYKTTQYPDLINDPNFVRDVKLDQFNVYESLMSMSPEERNQLSSGPNSEGYDSLEEAVTAWLEEWGL